MGRSPEGKITYSDAEAEPRMVKEVRSADIVFLKPASNGWIYAYCPLGKAKDWEFTEDSATCFEEENGERIPLLTYRFLTAYEGAKLIADFHRNDPLVKAKEAANPVETHKMAIISTAHMTESDSLALENAETYTVKSGERYLLYTATGNDVYFNEYMIPVLKGCFSDGFMFVFTTLRDQGCAYIMFDTEGAEYPNLFERFDW